jgi:hypothetical protein
MAPQEVIRYRLLNQRIVSSKFTKPEEVVAWQGAVQSQDYQGGLWGVALRTQKATLADIQKAIADRKIIRTWPMRGTLHFVAAADIRWMLELLTPRIVKGAASRHRQLGLDDAAFAKSRKLVIKALEGGKHLMRKEMYQIFERGGISSANQRGLHILGQLSQEGLICLGPHQGKQSAFALLEEWVPKAKKLDRDESLAELARRYFTSHGPATIQDFVWWSGLKVSDAKRGLEAVSSYLKQVTFEGGTYWMSRTLPKTIITSPDVHLLPAFDEYLVAYRNRSAAVELDHASKIFGTGNGIFSPVLVIDGKVAGTWSRLVKKDSVQVTLYPFFKLTKPQLEALEEVVERYGRFMGLPAVIKK